MASEQVGAMSLEDAINDVCLFLHRQECVFTLYRAWAGERTFRVAIHQNQPEDTMRTFDVLPTDVADCWDVKEVQSSL